MWVSTEVRGMPPQTSVADNWGHAPKPGQQSAKLALASGRSTDMPFCPRCASPLAQLSSSGLTVANTLREHWKLPLYKFPGDFPRCTDSELVCSPGEAGAELSRWVRNLGAGEGIAQEGRTPRCSCGPASWWCGELRESGPQERGVGNPACQREMLSASLSGRLWKLLTQSFSSCPRDEGINGAWDTKRGPDWEPWPWGGSASPRWDHPLLGGGGGMQLNWGKAPQASPWSTPHCGTPSSQTSRRLRFQFGAY